MAMRASNTGEWRLTPITAPSKGKARRGASPVHDLPKEFLAAGAEVEEVNDAELLPHAARRGAPPPLDVEADLGAGEGAVLVVRHPSGALTFHAPIERAQRGGKGRGVQVARFRVEVGNGSPARRGLLTKALKLILLKVKEAVLDKLTTAVVKFAGRTLEEKVFRDKGLSEGLFRVRKQGSELRLSAVGPGDIGTGRALLFIHGTFSNTQAAFKELAAGDFFAAAQALYGDRIYALDHYTLSRTPLENAQALLAALPQGPTTFDVITHSRGGLVLRSLCELRDALGANEQRFSLGRAVLVAAPNQGTPIATPDRWEKTIGVVANVLELFPDNPLTTAAEFVANGIVWLAKHVMGDLPGLASMDRMGSTIEQLQVANGPLSGAYWSLAANHHPDDGVWHRLLDAGIDGFFEGANDMVVPAEGSWVVDEPGAVIPAERIGCFGPGGNLNSATGPVHHLNFFGQENTTAFLLHALDIQHMTYPPIDPRMKLPVRRLLRSGTGAGARTKAATPDTEGPLAVPFHVRLSNGITTYVGEEDTLHLTILGGWHGDSTSGSFKVGKDQRDDGHGTGEPASPVIMAAYGAARIVEPFPTRDIWTSAAKKNAPGTKRVQLSDAGTRYSKIIAQHMSIRMNLESTAGKDGEIPELPDDEQLRDFGELLFRALFVGDVRHLYDVARAQQREGPLNIVFTCMIPWLASFPWEYAFDPVRRKFLATEEVHFVRNVLTAVPPQVIRSDRARMRILVVGSQPEGTVTLSLGEEEERIRHSFKNLQETGLVEIDVLVDITPKRLHEHIQASVRTGQPYDVVHFMGHAGFDTNAQEGRLLFMSSDGGEQEVDVRTLREILCDRGIHLVFLNACDTARDRSRGMERNKGVAQALVDGGLPAVVANQYPVLDSSAVEFAERFYWSIAIGNSLGEAVREARIAVNYSIDGDAIDWAVPVLYARDPGFRLRDLTAGRMLPFPEDRERRERINAVKRAARGPVQPLRVGLADIARYFPGAKDIVKRINEVQDLVLVELVDVTVPLGVWEIREVDDRRIRYLNADKFAAKLKDRPKALGVDLLQCITHHRISYSEEWDIYGWWSSDPALNVMVFSTAGLYLPNHGDDAGRVIANGLVENLASQLAESNGDPGVIHDRGPKNCPFYYNPDRDPQNIIVRHRFDKACRTRLLKRLPKPYATDAFIDALDAIMGAFGPQDVAPVKKRTTRTKRRRR